VMGKRDLDNFEYDDFLAKNKGSRSARQEVEQRHAERKNKGYSGWHWGLGDKPVYCRDKEEFEREVEKHGLVIRDDVKKTLR